MTERPFSEDASVPPKIDPERLVLRGNPVRVARFRRGAMIAAAAAFFVMVASLAWIALKPPGLSLAAGDDEQPQIASKAPPDALAGAPPTYSDIPQLGPPLPGDLGPAILEQQRQDGAVPPFPEPHASEAAEAERQRQLSELRSARQSSVMVQLASGKPVPQAASGAVDHSPVSAAWGPAPDSGRAALDPEKDPNAQQRKLDFVGKTDPSSDLNPHALARPASPYLLSAGSVIAASLLTGLNSDLPGMVTAQITENAYDSATGRVLLIPQGSRLIGSYDSVIAFGQRRALVVWQRIILPDGSSLRIDNVPATDAAGYAGLSDQVDRHTWQLLKGIALATLLGVGSELSLGRSEGDLVQAIRESAQQSGARAGDQLVARDLDVQPTLRVRPGWPLRVVVQKDLVLAPWGE